MSEAVLLVCVGFILGFMNTCACVLMGRVCFEMSVGSLSADYWVCILIFLVVWVRHPTRSAARSWIQVEVFERVLTN